MGTNDGYVERIGQTTYTVEVKAADGVKDDSEKVIRNMIRKEAMHYNSETADEAD